jgi:hypothetical protein
LKRIVATWTCLMVLSGCSSQPREVATSSPAVAPSTAGASTGVPSPSPSATRPPLTPAQLRTAALVPTSWDAPLSWKLAYDKETANQAITGCGGKKLTPSDLAMHQREWSNSQGTGGGEIAVVLAASDAPQNPTGNPGYRRGEALAALALADRQTCTHEHKPDGSDTVSDVDHGTIIRPQSVRFYGIDAYCSRITRKNHADSYSCWTAAGAGDVYAQLYGFGADARTAAYALSTILKADAEAFDALPSSGS